MLAVKIEQFEGPLDLLLRLIEQEQLDITEVSLAKVTDQYLESLERIASDYHIDELADFLVIAAKLLLIKSRLLLPQISTDEEQDIEDLQRQLKIYQEFANAAKSLEKLWNAQRSAFPRPFVIPERTVSFLPPQTLDAHALARIFRIVIAAIEVPVRIPKRIMFDTRVSIQDKIQHIRNLIGARASVFFHHALQDSASQSEIVVSFLALLELIKQRIVVADQSDLFTDIRITSHPTLLK